MMKAVQFVTISLMAAVFFLAPRTSDAQNITGKWTGTRSERNAVTGGTFTVNFIFEFAQDGSYRETASLGNATILRAIGQYQLAQGSKPGYPTVTHVLRLSPQNFEVRPAGDELRLLQMAELPNISQTDQYVIFFNLAPAGGMSLEDTAGGNSWGLRRVIQ